MWHGTLIKMKTRWMNPVEYELRDAADAENRLDLNPLLGQKLTLSHTGEVRCIHCGASTKKPYGEGSCYGCLPALPQNDICILKPELCHYHKAEDPCRDPGWGERNCFIPHILYLAVSSGLKVGITRHTQVPTRWIDQGASYALPVLRVADRFSVGKIEHALAQVYNDKTNWQRMLKHEVPDVDLLAERDRLLPLVDADCDVLQGEEVCRFEYPALQWPLKIISFNLEKVNRVEGRLLAIKGQYLILDSGVINIRKHAGWCITLEVDA